MYYREAAKRRICIDFDGTIVEESTYPQIGKLKLNVKESITRLREWGFYIAIYSCRNNPEIFDQVPRFLQMVDLLREEGVYYDEIILDPKPVAAYYIDDKNIEFTTWEDVLKRISIN